MSINIFRTGGASAFSRVYNFFSPAPKADSLVDKVLKLFMAIILAPVSAVKYSAGFVTSSFKKENPKTTSEKLAFAANTAVSRIKKAVESSENFVVKNQSTIIKVVIATAVVTGAVYAYRSYNGEIQTPPDDSRFPDGGGRILGKVLFGGSLAGVALGIVYAATARSNAPTPKTKIARDLAAAIKAASDVFDDINADDINADAVQAGAVQVAAVQVAAVQVAARKAATLLEAALLNAQTVEGSPKGLVDTAVVLVGNINLSVEQVADADADAAADADADAEGDISLSKKLSDVADALYAAADAANKVAEALAR